MNPILKLHMSGLGDGETPTLAIVLCDGTLESWRS
jgi:hypothetical protein